MFSGASYSCPRSSSCQTERSDAQRVEILSPENLICICPESLLTFLMSLLRYSLCVTQHR
jgi:hypothetical protein